MGYFVRNKIEFNGYLHSLRYICDKHGVDFFAITNECDINRVQKLYNSQLHNSNYILSLLWSDNFDRDLNLLIEKNRGFYQKDDSYKEDNYILSKRLDQARYTFCGLGTRKIKHFLDKKSNEDITAKILRLCLEIEECNIMAKNIPKEYTTYKYYEKQNMIEELIDLFIIENLDYGYKDSDNPSIRSIIFFDLYGRQLSWHTNSEKYSDKIYKDEWDGIINSNLLKIEEVIQENYQDELKSLI